MVQKFPKRDECRILYHITLKENLDSILDKGLIPDIGSQCTHCKNDNPTEKLVYMTDLEGIAKWKKALYGNSNSCVILEVNTLNLEIIYRRKFVEGTGEDAVCREIMEETGYVITPEVPKFVEVETSPKANKQNITLRYTALVPYKLLSQVKPIGGEDNEVEEVKWIDIRKLNNYKWAFNHNKIIERIILLKQYIQNDRHKHFS